MSSTRKSIIKSSKSKGENTRKRLSFAPDIEGEKTTEVRKKKSSDVSQLASSGPSAFANPSCKFTTLGMYYEPKTIRGVVKQLNTTPMNQSLRHDFMALSTLPSFPRNITADVLITGEKIFAEQLKMDLLAAHEWEKTKMGINITCEENLPATVKAHVILILLAMDTHESMRVLSNTVMRCTEGTLSSKRTMVLCLSSGEGCFRNVIDLQQFYTLLSIHQLVHLTIDDQGKLDYEEKHNIMEFIQKSVGYHQGSSLLLDYTMQLDLNCFVENTVPQDSSLSTTKN